MISRSFSRLAIVAFVGAFGAATAGDVLANERREHEQNRGHHEQFEHHARHEHRHEHYDRREHRRDEANRHEHSRRDQVNDRIEHQERQIGQERREGDLSSSQAMHLRQQERSVEKQEQADLADNHGHLTGTEQKQLNTELAGIEHEIPR